MLNDNIAYKPLIKYTGGKFKEYKDFSRLIPDVVGDYYEPSDFVFLDPPYDSKFNEYDSTAFTKEDQERLRKAVENIKCKWMMVIRNTPFIKSLYKGYNMAAFDKNYAFHARGTYDEKQCEHLVITNYIIDNI